MNRSPIFVHGEALDLVFDTEARPVQLLAFVEVNGAELCLRDTFLYPLTSAKLTIGVGEVLQLVRTVCDEARVSGFAVIRVEAYRAGGLNPGRMISWKRVLQ